LLQCWSAGYIEGVLTHEVIYDNYLNSRHIFNDNLKEIEDIKRFYSLIHENLSKKMTNDFFKSLNKEEYRKWAYIACIKAQLEGITAGYNKQSSNKLAVEDFYYMNTQGNFNDVRKYLQMKTVSFTNKHDFYKEENVKKVYR
jgi:hypothetical protein